MRATICFYGFFVIFITACSNNTVAPSKDLTKNLIKRTIPIPLSCLDQNDDYQFVSGLIGAASGSYVDKRTNYSPINAKGGYIKYDFNHDNLLDYIFLEKIPNKNNTRLMTCISERSFFGGRQYKRSSTPYLLREFKQRTLYVETTNIRFNKNTLSINFSTHAHNDGGETETSQYVFNSKANDFVLTKFDYSAYGEVFPEISQSFDFKKHTYKEERGCSFADNPIAMGYNPNCKPKHINRCLQKSKPQTIRTKINKDHFTKKLTAC